MARDTKLAAVCLIAQNFIFIDLELILQNITSTFLYAPLFSWLPDSEESLNVIWHRLPIRFSVTTIQDSLLCDFINRKYTTQKIIGKCKYRLGTSVLKILVFLAELLLIKYHPLKYIFDKFDIQRTVHRDVFL